MAADAGPDDHDHGRARRRRRQGVLVYAPVEGELLRPRAVGTTGRRPPAPPEDNATPRGSNELILRLDCELPHQYEVFAVVEGGLPGEPDELALIAAAKLLCPPAFAVYVGTPYQTSELEIGRLLPSADQLANQVIGCLAFDPAGKLVGSVRGTAAEPEALLHGPLRRSERPWNWAQRPCATGSETAAEGVGVSGPRSGAIASRRTRRGPRPGRRWPTPRRTPRRSPGLAGSSASASFRPTLSPAMVSGASSAMRSAHARPSLGAAHPVDEADWWRPLTASTSGAQQHVAGGRLPGQAHQPLHRPLVDHEAELGGGDPEGGVGGGDAQVARDGELGAGTEGEPLDRGDRRQRQVAQAAQHPAEAGDELGVLDPAQVGAGAEVAAGAGEDQHPGVAVAAPSASAASSPASASWSSASRRSGRSMVTRRTGPRRVVAIIPATVPPGVPLPASPVRH